jgi:uncharacterized protein (DUF2141 family)
MIRIIFVLLCLSFFQTLSGQITVNITITNLENSSGYIHLSFLDENNKELRSLSEKITNKQCTLTINDLKPSKYAFKYFHDENNNNKKMDTNVIGIPKEGYGFSNNAKGRFGPPDFKDTIFEIKNDTTIICTINYINI